MKNPRIPLQLDPEICGRLDSIAAHYQKLTSNKLVAHLAEHFAGITPRDYIGALARLMEYAELPPTEPTDKRQRLVITISEEINAALLQLSRANNNTAPNTLLALAAAVFCRVQPQKAFFALAAVCPAERIPQSKFAKPRRAVTKPKLQSA